MIRANRAGEDVERQAMENCLMLNGDRDLQAELEWRRFKRGAVNGLVVSVGFWVLVVVIIIIL